MFHSENDREIQRAIVVYLLVNAKNETQLKVAYYIIQGKLHKAYF
jgi:hypothetical protein